MKPEHLKFDPRNLRYTGIIGTGGIGSGKFFALNGNNTLGREESRSGHFMDVRDYCKQHIILHYIMTLLGPSFSVIPIGRLGDDDIGNILFDEMKRDGFDMKWIEKVPEVSTLFSFCFFYPDGSGGNLTTDDSASTLVDAAYIEKAIADIRQPGSEGIIMAAPEVPLEARKRLLELGKRHGLFCSASFTTGEMKQAVESGILKYVDLLSVNLDEAAEAAGIQTEKTGAEIIVRSSIEKLKSHNSCIRAAITSGKQGSWCWDGHRLNRFPAVITTAVSTAGAGDAFISGLLCGLALGLHLFEAQQLASLVAGLSVTSPHTINKEIDRRSLNTFLHSSGMIFSESVIKLLEE
jgi:sugar/nucleoside kinase (ribokinase family)